tara:strand:- start:14928 stop:16106 length:1179 start_codon:yes stop_codon:yes gene_type:complete
MKNSKNNIVNQFHKLFFNDGCKGKTWTNTFWLGTKTLKCPFDLWLYQEIIHETNPDIIIESGSAFGGSAFFLASICELVNNGKVISIDIKKTRRRPKHKRITYIVGPSTLERIVTQVQKLLKGKKRVMVILDSDHRKEHVLKELRIYSKFVSEGCYMIVEDTNINGHPVVPDFGPGPMEAVKEFLKENKSFSIATSMEKFYLTFNPKGFLLKGRKKEDNRNKTNLIQSDSLSGFPEKLSIQVNLAEHYFDTANYNRCIKKLRDVMRYTEKEFKNRITIKLALAYSKNNMANEAKKTIKGLNNNDIEVSYALGSIHKENNEFNSAIKYYKKVIQIKKRDKSIFWAGAYFHLGEIFLKLGKTSLATENFKSCLKFNPAHKSAIYHIESLDINNR